MIVAKPTSAGQSPLSDYGPNTGQDSGTRALPRDNAMNGQKGSFSENKDDLAEETRSRPRDLVLFHRHNALEVWLITDIEGLTVSGTVAFAL